MNEVYYPNLEIIGDGAKYVMVDGQLVPLVSRSATDRLRWGDRRGLIITTDDDGSKSANLPRGRVDHLPHHTS